MSKIRITIKPKTHTATTATTPTGKTRLKHVDLFAGTGAFTLAFRDTGQVDTVYANDMAPSSKQIYDLNFSHRLLVKDLNDIDTGDIPPHDILTAGFPCQPFSIAGHMQGFQDKRANVFWKVLEILECHKPRFLILENVKNLVTHDSRRTFSTIRSNLEDLGYTLVYKVVNTADITGIPQNRERIYIVGFLDASLASRFSLDFPAVEKRKITELLETGVPRKYYYSGTTDAHLMAQREVTKPDTVYQYRRVYIRENMSGECPTLTANMGTGGHNVPLVLDVGGPRKLTPRECFNFQGFPSTYNIDDFSDATLYKLAGNAVSVPVVRLIADRLVSLI
jgi:DNA (cytosine-5)-methyltransferase 1